MSEKRARAGKLSLYPLEFPDAVSAILKAKPADKPKKSKGADSESRTEDRLTEESDSEPELREVTSLN